MRLTSLENSKSKISIDKTKANSLKTFNDGKDSSTCSLSDLFSKEKDNNSNNSLKSSNSEKYFFAADDFDEISTHTKKEKDSDSKSDFWDNKVNSFNDRVRKKDRDTKSDFGNSDFLSYNDGLNERDGYSDSESGFWKDKFISFDKTESKSESDFWKDDYLELTKRERPSDSRSGFWKDDSYDFRFKDEYSSRYDWKYDYRGGFDSSYDEERSLIRDAVSIIGKKELENFMKVYKELSGSKNSERNKFFRHGIDAENIAQNSLQIPEYNKAIRFCTFAEEILKKDQIFNEFRLADSKANGCIDIKKMQNKILSLELDLEECFETKGDKNKEKVSKIEKQLEKLYQMELANEFKKVNTHSLRRSFVEIGISNISVAGNSYFVEMKNFGKVLRISAAVSDITVQVVDKTWKIKNFKTNSPENNELSPLEIIDPRKVLDRRDKLVKRNVNIMTNMLHHISAPRPKDVEKADVVNNLLRGFYCKPSEIREMIKYRDDVRGELRKNMRRLYKF